MTKSTDFGVGLMHEFAIAAAKAGWEPQTIHKLVKDDNCMRRILNVVNGTHKVDLIEHLINSDADPVIPHEGWTIKYNKKSGVLNWWHLKPLWHNYPFSDNKNVSGDQFCNEVRALEEFHTNALNANVLDHLVEHPEIIPKEWVEKMKKLKYRIFFWDTIYEDGNGKKYVSFLEFTSKWKFEKGYQEFSNKLKNFGYFDVSVVTMPNVVG